ncbi:hypothetical protein M3226_05220 [Neobacillus cucumis]|uniref:hypothetical protein n=1 Tax=Neobacillus cucumis TaxID=1740721 RepID=UPI00203E376F|nr:hypothetical protein [Neobacillus cucumis]MCM3725098.1 hypothetical protein [Neobacillus cucumis]
MPKYEDYFIKIYNSFITINSINKLTANELSIYCYLYTLRTYEDKILTNYDILCEENTFYKNKSDNKKEIRKCITSLMEKELIDVEEQNKSLTISFSFKEEGHVQLTYDKFRTFSKPRDLYIYVAVSKWEKKGGARYSYNEWAKLLDITREHAITVIEDACEREIIYKNIGTYTGNLIGSRNQKAQEENTYSIKRFTKDGLSINEGKNADPEFKLPLSGETNVDEKKEKDTNQNIANFDFDTGYWYEWDKYLEVNDCEIYLHYKKQSEKDERYITFIEHCENRINKILKSKGKKHFEEKLNKAKENLEERKRQQGVYDALVDKHIDELNDEDEGFKTSYVKKSKIGGCFFDDEDMLGLSN